MTDGDATPVFRRPATAQEAVLEEIRNRILDARLRPGAPVKQESFARELGVSRIPLREALRILEGEGRVTHVPHKGYLVAELSMEELREIYRIRGMLESEVIRAAIPRLTDVDIDEMRGLLEKMTARDGDTDLETHSAFHFLLLEAAGLRHFLHYIRLLWAATSPYHTMHRLDPEMRVESHREHRELLEAAVDRDSDRAVRVAREHRERALRELEKSRAREQAGGASAIDPANPIP